MRFANSLNPNLCGLIKPYDDWAQATFTAEELTSRDCLDMLRWDSQVASKSILYKPGNIYPLMSGLVGKEPTSMVGSKNPPALLEAIVARTRWEAKNGTEAREKILSMGLSEPPTYTLKFHDNRLGVVWELAKPVHIYSQNHLSRILENWFQSIGWDKFIDTSSATRYFPVPGKDRTWQTGKPLSVGECWILGSEYDPREFAAPATSIKRVQDWFKDQSLVLSHTRKEKTVSTNELVLGQVIPLWFLSQRYTGDKRVEADKRLEELWNAGDALGIVRPGGIQAPIKVDDKGLETKQAFYTWEEIFPDWTKMTLAAMPDICADLYYVADTSEYVRLYDTPGKTRNISREMAHSLRTTLATRGLSYKALPNETYSEIDAALEYIKTERQVDAVIPMPYRPFGFVQTPWGTQVLNCSKVQAMTASTEITEWGEKGKFPMLSFFFDHFIKGTRAQQVLLSWVKYAWTSFLAGKPEQGHALFIEGDPESGKSLFATLILPTIFGCSPSMPTQKMFHGSEFGREMFETSLILVDDQLASDTLRGQMQFTSWVKKLTSSTTHEYRGMWRDAKTTSWAGRLLVLFNKSARNRDILPRKEAGGTEGRWCSFVTQDYGSPNSGTQWPVSAKSAWERIVMSEAPFFLAWLNQWPTPDWVTNKSRWGINEWQEEIHLEATRGGDQQTQVLELIHFWFHEDHRWGIKTGHGVVDADANAWMQYGWTGSCQQLLAVVSTLPGGTTVTRFWTRSKLKTEMELLAQRPDETGVTACKNGMFNIKIPDRMKLLLEKGGEDMADQDYLGKHEDKE